MPTPLVSYTKPPMAVYCWPAPTMPAASLPLYVLSASDEIGKVWSRVTWVWDLNEKPARKAVWAVDSQPSVPLRPNSRLRWMWASWCFGISRPSTLTHLTRALFGG